MDLVIDTTPSPSTVGPPCPRHPTRLVRQVGTPPAVDSPGPRLLDVVANTASVRQFLQSYQKEVLGPVEMPVLLRAYRHALAFEVRELIALDASLRHEPRLVEFGEASQAVGRSQLRRLLPLQDQRLIRRYWQAVLSGQAHAWHPVVYGVVMALFSLPVRTGLGHYARKTLDGFIRSAGTRMPLGESNRDNLLAECAAAVPPLVERTLAAEPVSIVPCTLPLPFLTSPTGR